MNYAFRQNLRWDGETVDSLRTMWLSGLSGTQIARALRLTRGQVIGKINRMGLLKSPERPVKPVKPKRDGEWRRKPRTERAKPLAVQELVPADPVPFISRNWSQCAWIDDDPKRNLDALTCCGRAAKLGTNWCGYHYGIVYLPRKARAG